MENCDRWGQKCGYLLHFSCETVAGVHNKKAPRHVEQPKHKKHWCAVVGHSPDRSMYFSIFLSGCKQPNLSTSPGRNQATWPFRAAKVAKKSHNAIACWPAWYVLTERCLFSPRCWPDVADCSSGQCDYISLELSSKQAILRISCSFCITNPQNGPIWGFVLSDGRSTVSGYQR